MPSLEKINEYVISVCQQIRWKKVHLRISEEITNHVIDGRDAYIKQGLDEQEATERAIADTGDALTVGSQLDRAHRPKPQWIMFMWVTGLIFSGLAASLFVFGNENISNRLLWTAIGTIIMAGAYFTDFTILGRYPKTVCFGVGLLAWVGFQLQPSFHGILITLPTLTQTIQIIALLFPVIFAPVIFSAKGKGYRGLIVCLAAYVYLCLIAFAAPALSGFTHFAIIGKILLLVALLKNWFGINKAIGILLSIIPGASILAFMLFVYRLESWIVMRLVHVFNPHSDPMARGFLALRVRELLSGAVLLGEGTIPDFFPQSWLYSDFILSTIISRFGWLVFVMIMGALLFFIIKAAMRCIKQKSGLGFFVSLAIIITFSVQVFMYVTFNLGIILTHISLPFISPGNFAMLVNMGLMGFMLSVFRTGDAVIDKGISSSLNPQNNYN